MSLSLRKAFILSIMLFFMISVEFSLSTTGAYSENKYRSIFDDSDTRGASPESRSASARSKVSSVDPAISRTFSVPGLRNLEIGSIVTVTGPGRLKGGDRGEIEVQLQAWWESRSSAYKRLKVLFNEAVILVAVPDDRVEVHYDAIAREYYKDGTWKPFLSYEERELGPTGRFLSQLAGYNPVIGTVKTTLGLFNLLDQLARKSMESRKPKDPRFVDENTSDVVRIHWFKPRLPGGPPYQFVNDVLAPNTKTKLRVRIPIRAKGGVVNPDEICIYVLYAEESGDFGERANIFEQNYREAEFPTLAASPGKKDSCQGSPLHITGYWGDHQWSNKALAGDGDWNTAASIRVPNRRLYANHPYTGRGRRYWKVKYSSSGSQYTVFQSYDYDSGKWINVWVEKRSASRKTVTKPIPAGCLKANQPIKLRVHSATWAEYYEGYILCEE